jgi:hypothetical protein
MTDDEHRDLLHGLALRLERLDTKVDNLEKGVADLRGEMRTKLEGLENRLNTKASNVVVSLWGATLAIVLGGLNVLLRYLPSSVVR